MVRLAALVAVVLCVGAEAFTNPLLSTSPLASRSLSSSAFVSKPALPVPRLRRGHAAKATSMSLTSLSAALATVPALPLFAAPSGVGAVIASFAVGALCGWFFAKFFLAYMWAKKRDSLIRFLDKNSPRWGFELGEEKTT